LGKIEIPSQCDGAVLKVNMFHLMIPCVNFVVLSI
jgi:hypothetical protein